MVFAYGFLVGSFPVVFFLVGSCSVIGSAKCVLLRSTCLFVLVLFTFQDTRNLRHVIWQCKLGNSCCSNLF